MPAIEYQPAPEHKTHQDPRWGVPRWSPKRQPPASACPVGLPLDLPGKWLLEALKMPAIWSDGRQNAVDPASLGHGYPRYFHWYDPDWGWFEGRRTCPGPEVFDLTALEKVSYKGYPVPKAEFLPDHARKAWKTTGVLDKKTEKQQLATALARYGRRPGKGKSETS